MIVAFLLGAPQQSFGQVPPIVPEADSPQQPGSEFWVDIRVGSESVNVENLHQVGFDLTFEQQHLSHVDDEEGSILGDVQYASNVDSDNGIVGIGITRTDDEGVSGSGVVARVQLAAGEGVADGTDLTFTIQNVQAEDPSDDPIDLDPQDLNITVQGSNSAPNASDDSDQTDEDSQVSSSAPGVLGNDTDPNGDALQVSEVNGNGGNVGTQLTLSSGALLTQDADGSYSYDPNGQFEDLGSGDTATDSWTYTAIDGNGGSDQATVTVTINGVNDAPTASNDDEQTNEGQSTPTDVLANDADPDGSLDPSTVTVQSGPSDGSTSVDGSTGEVTYTPGADFAGEDSYTYTVADNDGAESNEATVTIDVNAAPTASDDSDQTSAGEPVTTDVLANDSDPDGSLDPSTVTVQSGPSDGSTSVDASTGEVMYTPDEAFAGEDSYTYTVADNDGAESNEATVTIDVNAAPTASDDDATTDEDSQVSSSAPGVLGNDTDPNGDALQVSEVNGNGGDVGTQLTLSSGALLTQDADGSYSYDPNGQYEDLGSGDTATDSWTYSATDGNGGSDQATVTVTINGSNDPPEVANSIADQQLQVDGTFEGTLGDVFTDPDHASLDFSASSDDSAVAAASTNNTDVEVTGNATGTVTITVTATDDDGGSSQDEFEVTVKESGAPVASAAANVSPGEQVDFGKTGVGIDFSSGGGGSGQGLQTGGAKSAPPISDSGRVVVKKFDSAPQDTSGISETNVSKYHFTIESEDDLNVGVGTKLRLDVSTLDGIDPDAGAENVTIYQRPSSGSEDFIDLDTTNYDPGANELWGTTGSFGEFVLASNTQSLPVELAGFNARMNEDGVRLTWTTVSETGNAEFRVQRKVGVSARRREWRVIGTLEGQGTTTEPTSYQFTDETPPYEADVLTYRLKQVDTDGGTSYSTEVTIKQGVREVQLLGTFPNPVRSRATLRYAVPERQDVRIDLYNVLGRQIQTVVNGKRKGRNEKQLNLSSLASGVYFVRLRTGGTTKIEKLTVVR